MTLSLFCKCSLSHSSFCLVYSLFLSHNLFLSLSLYISLLFLSISFYLSLLCLSFCAFLYFFLFSLPVDLSFALGRTLLLTCVFSRLHVGFSVWLLADLRLFASWPSFVGFPPCSSHPFSPMAVCFSFDCVFRFSKTYPSFLFTLFPAYTQASSRFFAPYKVLLCCRCSFL